MFRRETIRQGRITGTGAFDFAVLGSPIVLVLVWRGPERLPLSCAPEGDSGSAIAALLNGAEPARTFEELRRANEHRRNRCTVKQCNRPA
jgi:hypothetical protein